MKQIAITALSLIMILSLISCSRAESEAKAASRDLHFFYMELCPSCEEYEFAEDLAARVSGLGGSALNIIMAEDASEMKEVLTEKGLADVAHVLPLLVEGSEYTVGYDDIAARIDSLSKE